MTDELVIIVDTREKTPYTFEKYPVKVKREKLDTGDYSVEGFEDVFAIERKSIDDLVNTISRGRERFNDEIIRGNDLAEFDVYVEASKMDVKIGDYYSQMHPNAVLGSLRAWENTHNVDFIYTGSRERAEARTYSQLYQWANQYRDLLA